jgi:hypothetical protein
MSRRSHDPFSPYVPQPAAPAAPEPQAPVDDDRRLTDPPRDAPPLPPAPPAEAKKTRRASRRRKSKPAALDEALAALDDERQ